MLSKQFSVDSPPFPACLSAEALSNQLAELAGDDLRQVCIVFSGGKAEFYYDEDDAAVVAKSVFRLVRKQPHFAKRLQKDFNAHAKAQADSCNAMAANADLGKAIEEFAAHYAGTEAYAFLAKFSLPLLEKAAKECLEAHLAKKGRDEKIAEFLGGKQKNKAEEQEQPASEALAQAAVEIPAACQPYLDALFVLRKIGEKAGKANAECLEFSEPLFKQAALNLKLKPDEIRFMLPKEIAAALKAGGSPREVARERMKYCIFSQKEDFGTFYVGGNAKVFGQQVLSLAGDRTANK